MSHVFRSFLFAVMACFMFSPTAKAETILFFSPSRIEISDEKPVMVVNVTNTSSMARAYTISAEDLIMTDKGVTAPVDTFAYSAKRMIRFVPRQFVVKPGERQAIRVMARVPSGTSPGDYHTHLRFLEDMKKRAELNPSPPGDNKAAIQAPFEFEAMIPVIVSYGAVQTKLSLANASVRPSSQNAGDVTVTLDMRREGNGQGVAFIEFKHKETGTLLGPRRTLNIYRELDALQKDFEVDLTDGIRGGTLDVFVYDKNDPQAAPIIQQSLPLGR